MLDEFRQHLIEDEKSAATIEKYMRDLRVFKTFAGQRQISKLLTMEYKHELEKKYAVTSANSMLAALNTFLEFAGWHDCRVKQFKVQRQTYCSEEKELSRDEYFRLVRTASRNGNERLAMIIQTICSTGIRISELEHITVEAVMQGEATVTCKGKTRKIFLVRALQKKLKAYINKKKIVSGQVFVTASGRPVSRCNIWREMKLLCRDAGVPPGKVFPHNLRHLFARVFYSIEKDIAKLADILGHSSINTTRIYIITTGNEHKKRMERMKLIL